MGSLVNILYTLHDLELFPTEDKFVYTTASVPYGWVGPRGIDEVQIAFRQKS